MIWPDLADSLIALVEALIPPAGSGLVVTDADVEVPLEIFTALHGDELILLGSPGHSRWKTGVLPPVHLGRLHVTLETPDGSIEDHHG
jgi:hypothetical protein